MLLNGMDQEPTLPVFPYFPLYKSLTYPCLPLSSPSLSWQSNPHEVVLSLNSILFFLFPPVSPHSIYIFFCVLSGCYFPSTGQQNGPLQKSKQPGSLTCLTVDIHTCIAHAWILQFPVHVVPCTRILVPVGLKWCLHTEDMKSKHAEAEDLLDSVLIC